MAKIIQDSQGSLFIKEGSQYTPVTELQARAFQRGEDPLANAAQQVGAGATSLVAGAASLLNPGNEQVQQALSEAQQGASGLAASSSLLAPLQYAPQVGAGVAGAGLGILPTAGLEGLLGAATTPENPLFGAAVGAVAGGAGAALPGAVSKGWQAAKSIERPSWLGGGPAPVEIPPVPGYARVGDVPAVAPDSAGAAISPVAAPGAEVVTPSPATPPGPGPRMAERVTAAMAQADEASAVRVPRGDTRMMSGQMSPHELYELGVPTTPGEKALLNASNNGADATAARKLRFDEDMLRSANTPEGDNIRMIKSAQKDAATNYLARELDMPPGIGLHDPALGEQMEFFGNRFDAIAEAMGDVPLDDTIRADLNRVIELGTGRSSPRVKAIVEDALKLADQNGGRLSGQDWGLTRSRLNEVIEHGTKRGWIDVIEDANDVMDTLAKALEKRLPDELQTELAKLRKQYAIAATLKKAGARDAEGRVNVTSFYNNWKRPQGMKQQGRDDVGRFMNTMSTLNYRPTPDSGTAPRLSFLQKLTDAATDFIPGVQQAKRILSP